MDLNQLIRTLTHHEPNYSETKRLVRAILGPQGRVKRENNTVYIGFQKDNVFVAWGEGETYQKAFLHAFRDSLMDAMKARTEAAEKFVQSEAAEEEAQAKAEEAKTAIAIDSNSIPSISSGTKPNLEPQP